MRGSVRARHAYCLVNVAEDARFELARGAACAQEQARHGLVAISRSLCSAAAWRMRSWTAPTSCIVSDSFH